MKLKRTYISVFLVIKFNEVVTVEKKKHVLLFFLQLSNSIRPIYRLVRTVCMYYWNYISRLFCNSSRLNLIF